MAGRGKAGLFEPIIKWLKNAIKHRHHGTSVHPHAPSPHVTPRHTTRPMNSRFLHETDPLHPQNPFRPRAVRRLSPAELEQHRVFIDPQGNFRHAHDGSMFDTRGSTTHWSGPSDRAIFTMDGNGNLYASKYQAVGDFHHSTLANGGPVAAAGEIAVHDGRVQLLTSQSGHYTPSPSDMKQVLDEFGRFGVHNVPVFDFNGIKIF
jgi:hypothetical protein